MNICTNGAEQKFNLKGEIKPYFPTTKVDLGMRGITKHELF